MEKIKKKKTDEIGRRNLDLHCFAQCVTRGGNLLRYVLPLRKNCIRFTEDRKNTVSEPQIVPLDGEFCNCEKSAEDCPRVFVT